jgi:hypothetical protein
MKIGRLINVTEFSKDSSNVISISKNRIKKTDSGPLYLGGRIASTYIPTELKISKRIQVRFLNKNKVVQMRELHARIFRPLLEVVGMPQKIKFDKSQNQVLPLSMKYSGFGNITIVIEGRIGGKLVTRSKSHEYEYNVFNHNPTDGSSSIIKDMLLEMAIDFINKHPVSHVKLAHAETTIETVILPPREILEISIRYSDILGNVYPEIFLTIPVETSEKTKVEIPVRIIDWKQEPFVNVMEMQI